MYAMLRPFGGAAMRQLNPSTERTPFSISEIMYHPSDSQGTNSLEFIEIFNSEPLPRKIGGFRISGDVDYTFPEDTTVNYRSYVVVARDPAAVEQAYGIEGVLGPYSGNLSNAGGTVTPSQQA